MKQALKSSVATTADPGIVVGMVSTIIPVYNRPSQLREAVASALLQDYRPIEIIIVDDGSTDQQTPEVAGELAANSPDIVHVLRIANSGPGLAREAGRKIAKGEFIQYLDSDDVLLKQKFSRQVQALSTRPEADVAYGITFFRKSDGILVETPHKDTGIERETMFPVFLNARWWETATPLYRRAATDRAGSWTALRLEEDWEYDCRIAALGGRLAYVPWPVSEHRDHSDPRLSRGEALDPRRLRMRAQSHALVWQHAVRAELSSTSPNSVALFARSLFLLARQCGAAGLADESRATFLVAREADLSARTHGAATIRRQLAIYRYSADIVGWSVMGKLSNLLDIVRDKFRP